VNRQVEINENTSRSLREARLELCAARHLFGGGLLHDEGDTFLVVGVDADVAILEQGRCVRQEDAVRVLSVGQAMTASVLRPEVLNPPDELLVNTDIARPGAAQEQSELDGDCLASGDDGLMRVDDVFSDFLEAHSYYPFVRYFFSRLTRACHSILSYESHENENMSMNKTIMQTH